MDFKTREVRFGLNQGGKFDEQEVKSALKAQGFAEAEVKSVS